MCVCVFLHTYVSMSAEVDSIVDIPGPGLEGDGVKNLFHISGKSGGAVRHALDRPQKALEAELCRVSCLASDIHILLYKLNDGGFRSGF